jgi:hypothetical protein
MSVKGRLDHFERQLKLATVALSRRGRLPIRLQIINDPEEGLEEFRLDGLDPTQIIEIGEPQFEALRKRSAAPLRE